MILTQTLIVTRCTDFGGVAGSMGGTPMEVAIALSLILCEVNTGSWENKMFTFDSTPVLVTVAPDTPTPIGKLANVAEMVKKTRAIPWGGSTDFQKTMEIFLETSKAMGTTIQEMNQQKLVVFSDMEFDDSYDGPPWQTTHESLEKMFQDAGYPTMIPIVYWNLRSSTSVPVKSKNSNGVVLLSGYSTGLLKFFLKGELSAFTPSAQLAAVLDLPIYAGLKVIEDDRE